MKKIFLFTTYFGIALCFVKLANAQPISTPSADVTSTIVAGIAEPCLPLRTSCQNAGFIKNDRTGKDIWNNCIRVLLEGKELPNYKFDPQEVTACKNEIDSLPCMPVLKSCNVAGYNSSGPGKLALFDCVFPLTQGKQVANVSVKDSDLNSCKIFINKVVASEPCLRVMLACKNAGYSPDPIHGTTFAIGCFVPVTEGKHVPGVNVDAASAAACYAKTHPKSPTNTPTQQISY